MILHLTTLHQRDDTRIFIKEAKTLASNLPHDVLLMVADSKGSLKEKRGEVSIYDIGCLGGSRLRRALIGPWRAFFEVLRLRPAIIHFHDPELIPLGILLRMIGSKVIYDVHEDVPRQIISKYYIPKILRHPAALATGALEWVFARSCTAIVPATPKIAERFPISKTVVVQNFPIAAELLISSPVPYNERPQTFVYPGVIATIRGIVEMLRAFECLHDITGARLELAGEFSPPSLEEALRALPGWAAVNYHGWVSRKQMAGLLCGVRAGLVVHHPVPNEIDAQPIKMFEYMSAGLPVIASDFPVWRRIIDDAGCGLLVDPLNAKAIAEAMRWILNHPTEAEAMGRRGRQAVERIYNWNVEATKLVGLYKKLLALSPCGAY